MQFAGGAAVVLIAVMAAALPGVAKSAMLDWKNWGKPQKEGQSVGFIWDHTYAGLKRPSKPVTLLRVTADHPAYWKAVVLDTFDGVKWVQQPNAVDTAQPPKIVVPQDQLSPAARGVKLQRSSVNVHNINLATRDLVGPSEIVSFSGIADEAGTISAERGRDVRDRQQRARRLELAGRLRAGAADDQAAHAVAGRLSGRRPVRRPHAAVAERRRVPGLGDAEPRGAGHRPPQRELLRPAARALARRVQQAPRRSRRARPRPMARWR